MDSTLVFNLIWELLLALYAVTVIVTICVVVFENRSPVRALAWVTVLIVVPAIGLILYFVFGRNIRSKKLLKRSQKRKLRLHSSGRQLSFQKSSLSEDSHSLIRLASTLGSAPAQIDNGIIPFNDGKSKFDALIADLEKAEKYIYFQYYIIADDEIGNRICNLLKKKVNEGVKVTMIYDPVGSFPTKKKFFKDLLASGINAKPFIPVRFPAMGIRINWRNHRKLCVIDGCVGYIGGMNVADRYLDGGDKFNMWRDLHLRVEGPVVASFESLFISDWNFLDTDIERFLENTPHRFGGVKLGNVVAQLVASGPTSQWYSIELLFLKAISLAKNRVYIATPYFLPTEGLLSALQSAALSKVDVRIMVPMSSDSKMLTYATASYVAECLRAGIKFYFFKPGMMHSKMLLIDDEITSVGSTNFDFRSFEHNFEANLFIYSKAFNELAANMFYDDLKRSDRVRASIWRHRSLKRKAAESFTRLFAPIL